MPPAWPCSSQRRKESACGAMPAAANPTRSNPAARTRLRTAAGGAARAPGPGVESGAKLTFLESPDTSPLILPPVLRGRKRPSSRFSTSGARMKPGSEGRKEGRDVLHHFRQVACSTGELARARQLLDDHGKSLILPYDQFIEHDCRHLD